MTYKNPSVEALLEWARAHGTSISPNVQIYTDVLTGLSFRALQDIPPSTKLVNCSYATTLSYLNAMGAAAQFERHSEPFPASFLEVLKVDNPHIIGHFYIMQQFLLKDRSFWWHYIRLLPQPHSGDPLGLPVLWPEEDRRWLDGTNAEPPIKRRNELWEQEWEQGIALLKKEFQGWEDYTLSLYQWAAGIFGSRGFRASLTVPEEILVKDSLHFSEQLKLNLEHIKRDRFSVLLPVTDIGNHDGVNHVEWAPNPTHFSLINRLVITTETQIYNYYGDKSNSELLVGYGFTLPDSEKDIVNLKLTPSTEAVQLRRSQNSHEVNSNQPEQEFMFHVLSSVEPVLFADKGLAELKVFSSGLINTMSCMVANRRERQYLLANPAYSVENDHDVLGGPLSRNIILVLRILRDKLEYELSRIQELDASLGEPRNKNQRIALDYRNRQARVLQTAIPPISTWLQFLSSASLLSHIPYHFHGVDNDGSSLLAQNLELISLEYAYAWLHQNYPELAFQVCRLISEDQQEPLPLNWAILVEDWSHTYWSVWLYILWTLRRQDKEGFQTQHPYLETWMSAMDMAYDQVIATDPAAERPYADQHERETIDFMIQNTAALPTRESFSRLRDFATYISEEETVLSSYKMQSGPQAGEFIEQRLLCIARIWPDVHHEPSGPWSTFLKSVG
ncbi:SET domain-containing protein [Diplocarpon rosae]|nr:SET domain-containing protein [Diplocarpon rosae]